jgi:hypothetical protein
MTEPAPARLRLSSPGDLVEAVPYLLGFHPEDSIVALAMRGSRRRVVFTMRLDLHEPGQGAAPGPDCDPTDLGGEIARYLAHAKAEQAVLVTYGAPAALGRAIPHRELTTTTTLMLSTWRIELADALYVGAGRWWSYTCTNPVCCPPEGTPLLTESCSTVAATATYAGLVAMPSREALEQTLEPVGSLAAAGMRQALARVDAALAERVADEASLQSVRAESIGLLTAAVDSGQPLSDDEAARLVLGLDDIVVRDACCEWATTERSGPARRLWTQLARRAVPPWGTVPLSLVGWFAYLDGDATLASIAVARCLRADPSYRLALLLRGALQRAVDPAVVRADCVRARGQPSGGGWPG